MLITFTICVTFCCENSPRSNNCFPCPGCSTCRQFSARVDAFSSRALPHALPWCVQQQGVATCVAMMRSAAGRCHMRCHDAFSSRALPHAFPWCVQQQGVATCVAMMRSAAGRCHMRFHDAFSSRALPHALSCKRLCIHRWKRIYVDASQLFHA